MPVPLMEEESIVRMHHWNITTKPKKIPGIGLLEEQRLSKKEVHLGPGPITWTVSDIAKAACLLASPPLSTHFSDEQEMRRVYTLIYDVFRYKNILNQALNDIAFFQQFYDLKETTARIWLLLYDLYHRSFRKREPAVLNVVETLFKECGITAIEEALWSRRVRLAAAVARLRIKNSALQLSQLLPKHLRDERVTNQADLTPVTCWVNSNKVKCAADIVAALEKHLSLKYADDYKTIGPSSFKWDSKCPQFVIFHPSMRTKIAQSSLVLKHKLIVQDRSFCIGPAAFGLLLSDLELTGNVVQSHVNSPRTTAYLATLLSQNEKVRALMVFSAGNRKKEYEEYLNKLGMSNVSIFSEKLIDMPPDANCFDEVIAVFATPPNSYSAVNDPIDLVCSRGGDLSMLEVLTESEMTADGRERVANILEEQRKTLRFAMSRPQIQFVLYETHSELDAENDSMVQKAVKEMNRIARIRHAAQQGKLGSLCSYPDLLSAESKEINNNERFKVDITSLDDQRESVSTIQSKRQSFTTKHSMESTESDERIFKDVKVPDTDLFDVPNLTEIKSTADTCTKLSAEGCFLALLQRKQVTRLDNKYMIKMAETRGLFGTNSMTSGRTKGSRGSKSKKEKRAASPPPKIRRKTKALEVQRIAAPTQASIRHSTHLPQNVEIRSCPKQQSDEPFVKEMDLIESTATKVIGIAERWEHFEQTGEFNMEKAAGPLSNSESSTSNVESTIMEENENEGTETVKKENIVQEVKEEDFVLKDPYPLLQSLTRRQIKTLINPLSVNRDELRQIIEANKRVKAIQTEPFEKAKLGVASEDSANSSSISNRSGKSSIREEGKRKKRFASIQIINRLTTPTQTSIIKQAKNVEEDYTYHPLYRKFQCEKCRKRNMA